MNTDSWQRARSIFLQAIEFDGGEREAFVLDQCGDDTELTNAVQQLLASDDSRSNFLEEPLVDIQHRQRHEDFEQRWIGKTLGSYRLLEVVGRGGMSTVYKAERADGHFEQTAVVKFIQWGRNTPEFRDRLRSERQILATLEHPNIARLIDGGETDDGDPYLVMEYVEGVPIDVYCNDNDLSVRERVELFRGVCDALAYAHRRLVIHRDLKPGNILVTSDGQSKLLDFGIAKLVNEGSEADVTAPAARVLTPNYASPEQILGEAVTTVSDVFSSGVLLYELLAGQRPFDWRGQAPVEVQEALESEAIVVPSEAAAATDPARGKSVKGDLDNIVLKTMRRQPENRYRSVESLSDDLDRYLDGQPVKARPQTWGYRTRRWVARNRLAATIAGVLLATVFAYAGTTAYQARKLRQRQDELVTQRDQAQATLSFLGDVLRSPDPTFSRGEEVTLRALIDRKVPEVMEMNDRPALQAEVLIILGEVYLNLGQPQRSIELFKKSVSVRQETYGPESLQAAAGHKELGGMFIRLGDDAAGLKEIDVALAIERAQLSEGSFEMADTLQAKGISLIRLGNLEEAEKYITEALAIHRRELGDSHPNIADDYDAVAWIARGRGDFKKAEDYLKRSLEIRRQEFGELHPRVAGSLNNLGALARASGDLESAERWLRDSMSLNEVLYGEQHQGSSLTRRNLATVLVRRRDYAAAKEIYERSLAISNEIEGDAVGVASAFRGLATVNLETGNAAAAESYFRQVLDSALATSGPDLLPTAEARTDLARSLNDQGKHVQAAQELALALATYRSLPENHIPHAHALSALATSLHAQGRHEQAELRFEETLDLYRNSHEPDHPTILAKQADRAWNLAENGQSEPARLLFEETLDKLAQAQPSDPVLVARTQMKFADLQLSLGNASQAKTLAGLAAATLQKELTPNHPDAAVAKAIEAGAHAALGDFANAIEVLHSIAPDASFDSALRKRAVVRSVESIIESNAPTEITDAARQWLRDRL